MTMMTLSHMLTLARNGLLAGLIAVTTAAGSQHEVFMAVNPDRIARHEAQYEQQLVSRRTKRRTALVASIIAGAGTVAFVSHQWLKKDLAQPNNGGSGGPRASGAQASDAQAARNALVQQAVAREAERYTFKGIVKNTTVQSVGVGLALGVSGWALDQGSKLITGTNAAWVQDLFPFNDKDLLIHATARLSHQAQAYQQLASQELVILANLEPTQTVSRTILIKNIQFNHNSTLRMLERLVALSKCSLRGFTDTDGLVAEKLKQLSWQLDSMAQSYATLFDGTFAPSNSINMLQALNINVQQLAMMIVDLCQ